MTGFYFLWEFIIPLSCWWGLFLLHYLELYLLTWPGGQAMNSTKDYTNGKFWLWLCSSKYLLSLSTKSFPTKALPSGPLCKRSVHSTPWATGLSMSLALANGMWAKSLMLIKAETKNHFILLLFPPQPLEEHAIEWKFFSVLYFYQFHGYLRTICS